MNLCFLKIQHLCSVQIKTTEIKKLEADPKNVIHDIIKSWASLGQPKKRYRQGWTMVSQQNGAIPHISHDSLQWPRQQFGDPSIRRRCETEWDAHSLDRSSPF